MRLFGSRRVIATAVVSVSLLACVACGGDDTTAANGAGSADAAGVDAAPDEAAVSEAASSDAAAIDASASDATLADAAADAALADATVADGAVSDGAVSDSGETPDATVADGSVSGGGASDGAASDASTSDSPADAAAVGTNAGDATATVFDGGFTLALSDASVVSTYAQRAELGFKFGYVDGVLGAFNEGDAGYSFFVSGHTVAADAGACSESGSTPDTQGGYRIGIAPNTITQNFGCRALIADSQNIVPDGGVLGPYDRDYVGGGPVIALTYEGSTALALIYHAEFHWGPTCNDAPCFYGTLGLAVSLDGGGTFTKLGEIVQPAVARPDWVMNHSGNSLSIGAGPFVIGDVNGAPVDPTTADPASSYAYVFFDDYDSTNAAPCANAQCVAVARASVEDLVNAAFSLPGAKASTALFAKYHTGDTGGLFEQAAASGSADDETAGGHYTALFNGAFELSALYDQPIDKFLLAYRVSSGAIALRTSSSVTSWPTGEVSGAQLEEEAGVRYPSLMGEQSSAELGGTEPYLFYTNGLDDWKTSTFMSRRILIAPAQ